MHEKIRIDLEKFDNLKIEYSKLQGNMKALTVRYSELRDHHIALMQYVDSIDRVVNRYKKELQIIENKDYEITRLENRLSGMMIHHQTETEIYQEKYDRVNAELQKYIKRNNEIKRRTGFRRVKRQKIFNIVLISYSIIATLSLITAVES